MICREYNESDYEMLKTWWKAYDIPPIPEPLLSKRGYIVCDCDFPVFAGFLYKDDTSALGMLGWIVGNKEATKEQRHAAFPELIKHIENVAKQIGIQVIMATGKVKTMDERLTEFGYTRIQEEGMHYYLKGV